MNNNSKTNSKNSSLQTSSDYESSQNQELAKSSPPQIEPSQKREIARKQIEKYFYQLTEGCGDTTCRNKYCASGDLQEKLTPNQAAIRAIQLYTQEAHLCSDIEIPKSKVQRTVPEKQNTNVAAASGNNSFNKKLNLASNFSSAATGKDASKVEISKPSPSSHQSTTELHKEKETKLQQYSYLDEPTLSQMLNDCQINQNYSPIIRSLGFVFSSPESIAKSFQKVPKTSIDAILEKVPSDPKTMKKEELRSLEGDLDKDEDCSAVEDDQTETSNEPSIDFESLRSVMKRLYEKNPDVFSTLNNALESLSTSLLVSLRISKREQIEEFITVFVILFEIFQIGSSVLIESSIGKICSCVALLPIWAQARIAQIWSEYCRDGLQNILQFLQQLITLQVISNSYYRELEVHDNEIILNATKVLRIVFWANILSSKLESSKLREPEEDVKLAFAEEDDGFYSSTSDSKRTIKLTDPIAEALDVNLLDCREPFIPFEEFHNEPLNDAIAMDTDYLRYRSNTVDRLDSGSTSVKKFSFMLYPFILTPATKTLALFFDSRIKMYSERRFSSLYTHFVGGQQAVPYLKLKVRRDHLIDDALVELEMVALSNPKDLKKQTVVEFVGEQGVDEGGVSKEFFQLIVEEIFNPDYSMFVNGEDNPYVWFNSLSYENEAQFTLIGIVLGLAIYNNVILPVNFPMVVYRKLMGLKGSFQDLKDFNPVLYNSLSSMLDYQESDFEGVFNQTFEIGYQDVFGNKMSHILKENGDKILVNQDNKQEFVDLYADYLLNVSIEKQFKAFKKGFQMVTDESPLHLLFRPEEVELLVCGSKNFDFDELEESTEYDGGYTAESEIIKHFWSIVHGLSLDSKRKLLQFTTGSDRIPVGGLSKLKLIIARNGPDCDRLPTSHTCFNILLMPEYSSREKLEERLLKAINYSKGFGML